MPSPEETNAAAREFLSDHPAAEASLEALLERDARGDPWTFEETELDSGRFGELVSRDLATAVDDGYRLANPEAIEAALNGDAVSGSAQERSTASTPDLTLSLAAFDRVATATLAAILALTIVIRASTYRSVFRDRVMFLGNDPYLYVYVVESGLRNGWSLSEIPLNRATEEPLTTAQLLYSAEIAGGLGSHAAILAWAPVIAAVGTVFVLYLFVHELSDDRRIALGAAFALAVMPVHALRSSLGFVDHHAFDFFWLVVVAWGLTATLTVDDLRADWPTARAVGLLGIGVFGVVSAWWAGTLLLAPIGIAVVAGCSVAVRDDASFLAPGTATSVGLGIGAALVGLAHVAVGWHSRLIAAVPAVLFAGSVLVVATAAAWRRADLPAWAFPGSGLALVGVTTLGVYLGSPSTWARIERELQRLAGIGFGDTVEFQSIFSTATMGWLLSFGFLLLFAIPYMAWGVAAVYRGNRRWLGVTAYAWFTLALAISLSRFAGEFAPFLAVFAGLGFVHVAAWIEVLDPPVPFGGERRRLSLPEPRALLQIVLLVGLISSLSIAMAPVSANNLAFGDNQYEATAFIDQHAAEHDYEYPDSYVFSPWSWNRMYNYHVNGEARSYAPARSHYRNFSLATGPAAATDRVDAVPGNSKYVVTEPYEPETPPESMQTRLHDRLGSAGDGVDGLAHFRALYASPSGDYKVFRYVPGATLNGSAAPGETVTVSTEIDIEGASFTYERRVEATEDGQVSVTVPYPTAYEVEYPDGATTAVTVEQSAIDNGETVRIEG